MQESQVGRTRTRARKEREREGDWMGIADYKHKIPSSTGSSITALAGNRLSQRRDRMREDEKISQEKPTPRTGQHTHTDNQNQGFQPGLHLT